MTLKFLSGFTSKIAIGTAIGNDCLTILYSNLNIHFEKYRIEFVPFLLKKWCLMFTYTTNLNENMYKNDIF